MSMEHQLIHVSIKTINGQEIKIAIKNTATMSEFFGQIFAKLPFENADKKLGK